MDPQKAVFLVGVWAVALALTFFHAGRIFCQFSLLSMILSTSKVVLFLLAGKYREREIPSHLGKVSICRSGEELAGISSGACSFLGTGKWCFLH